MYQDSFISEEEPLDLVDLSESSLAVPIGTLSPSLLSSSCSPVADMYGFVARQTSEASLFGIEGKVYIATASGALAILLFTLSALAYKKERRSRLRFVMGAFSISAIKSSLVALNAVASLGVLSGEPVALLLDFGVLALFFLGLVKK